MSDEMEIENANSTEGIYIDGESNWFYDAPSDQIWSFGWDRPE